MSAAPTPPTGPAPVPPAGTTPPVEHPPGHPHHGKTPAELAALEVQDNALYRGLNSFWTRLKSGNLLPSKVLAVLILVAVGGGLWWWFAGQSKKTDSRRWAELLNRVSGSELKAFADDNPDTPAALVARRSRALELLVGEGTQKLKGKVYAEWIKAVGNIEAARAELIALAEAFKRNPGLAAACYRDAALAERALIGLPKKGRPDENPENQRGSVAAAADLYRKAAAAIGADTPAGVKYAEEAKKIETNAAALLVTNSTLYAKVMPEETASAPTTTLPSTTTPDPDPKKTPSTNLGPRTPSTSGK